MLRTFVFCGVAVLAFAGAVIWGAGEYKTIRNLRLELAAEQAASAEYRKKVEDNEKRLAIAISERDRARAAVASLRADLAGVRLEAGKISAELRAMSPGSGRAGDADQRQDGRCEQLLAEATDLLGTSAELLSEGAELATQLNADRTATRQIMNK